MLAKSHLQAIICTENLAEAKRFYGEVLELSSKGQCLGAENFLLSFIGLLYCPAH